MQQSKKDVELGRFLSLILRHNPSAAGISLDLNGWADVDKLLAGVGHSGRWIDKETLERLVRENNKQRYSFNENHTKIRANQGHSLAVDIELSPKIPPDILYHGTATRFLPSIRQLGITKQNRQHVHLSADLQTAVTVGKRHGKAVVLSINTAEMVKDGYVFYYSENKVWLCDIVPWHYITETKL